MPKKKGKNSSSCAGEPYGFEPVNDSKMRDERGVEHEAPPASHLLSIHRRIMKTRILAASFTAARSRMIATRTGKREKALSDQWQ